MNGKESSILTHFGSFSSMESRRLRMLLAVLHHRKANLSHIFRRTVLIEGYS